MEPVSRKGYQGPQRGTHHEGDLARDKSLSGHGRGKWGLVEHVAEAAGPSQPSHPDVVVCFGCNA